MYLFERALHGVLLAALAQEEAAVAAGQAGAGGSAAAGEAAEGGTPALSSAARDRVVEAVLADAEHQLGLVHTCVEVGAGRRAIHVVVQPLLLQEACCTADSSSPPHLPPSCSIRHPPALQVVNYAYMGRASQAFPWATLQLGRLHHCLELWQVGAAGGRGAARQRASQADVGPPTGGRAARLAGGASSRTGLVKGLARALFAELLPLDYNTLCRLAAGPHPVPSLCHLSRSGHRLGGRPSGNPSAGRRGRRARQGRAGGAAQLSLQAPASACTAARCLPCSTSIIPGPAYRCCATHFRLLLPFRFAPRHA